MIPTANTILILAIATVCSLLFALIFLSLDTHRKRLDIHREQLDSNAEMFGKIGEIIDRQTDAINNLAAWIEDVDEDLYATPSEDATT